MQECRNEATVQPTREKDTNLSCLSEPLLNGISQESLEGLECLLFLRCKGQFLAPKRCAERLYALWSETVATSRRQSSHPLKKRMRVGNVGETEVAVQGKGV
jgi:hypothetical protein